MGVDGRPMAVISGTANRPLAEKIVSELGMDLLPVEFTTLRMVRLVYGLKNRSGIRGFSHTAHVSAVNENLMQLLIMLDALRRASVAEITVIMLITAMHGKIERANPGNQFRQD